MIIAPSKHRYSWTDVDWKRAKQSNDWNTMVRIFKDRYNFRYLAGVKAMMGLDRQLFPPRLGFSIVALDCLLIETLNQFYRDKKETVKSRKNHKKGGELRKAIGVISMK